MIEIDITVESYPSEFTFHHLPLLFVAGLNTASTTTQQSSTSNGPSSSTASPLPSTVDLPVDEFATLIQSLRKTLLPKKPFQIWDNSRGTECEFHTVLVEKNVRFPPLKARPTSTAQPLPLTLHSPISPLSPSSPLYPDGIMAPIWIRKHREMIPCVFILVLRLYEYEPDGSGPLDSEAKEDLQRTRDTELVHEILERKRTTIERGIKLAVVLLCSRTLLDSPSLDLRLSLIRRQSGLDSRASLFVISPVPIAEVHNFVLSLRSELFPAALDYYREHGRRVRRKRARVVPKGKLSEKSWAVRYDYKMAMFAEMRGEIEVSLKHYEDCYETLVDMFAITTLLTPRTKRWAEAKVLADCLTVKMYLYLNEPSRAVAQLNRHTVRFRELSNTWGIGEQTFEFWSWLSKQYRLFADLSVIASRAGFRIPSLIPPPSSTVVPLNSNNNSPGLIPAHILQHSGYYFYLSGTCAVMRRERFRAVMKGIDPSLPLTPAITHETKINHGEIIIDLFTKAYEYFKANKTSRMTLYIASQIALAHFDAGNHEMALKFHERIARTYRRESWRNVLDSIIELTYISAARLDDFEMAIKCLVELMAPDSKIPLESRERYSAALDNLLNTKVPTSPEKSTVSIDMSEIAALFQCRINFWNTTSNIGISTPFQLSLSSSSTSRTSSFTFASLEVHFNDVQAPIIVSNDYQSSKSGDKVEYYSFGESNEETKSSLSWSDGSTKVFAGNVTAGSEIDLTVSKVVLILRQGDWTINLELIPDYTSETGALWYSNSNPIVSIPLHHSNPSICHIRPRELDMDVQLVHASPAYLDEEYEVHVDVTNKDSVEVEVSLDILLHPGDSANEILVDDLSFPSICKNVIVGTISPGNSVRKTFRVFSPGLPGDRHLDISIHSQPTLLNSSSAISTSTEVFKSLIIPVVKPLYAQFETRFHKKRRNGKALLDMTESDGWEGASDVEVGAKIFTAGPWEIEVVGLKLVCENTPSVRVASSSLDDEELPLSLLWRPDELFSIIYRLDVLPAPSLLEPTVNSGAFVEVSWKRSGSSSNTISKAILPLPALYSTPLVPTVTLPLPPTMILHQPTTLTYKFSNPTRNLLQLSIQMDSSEGFVFAGPRKFPVFILAPGELKFESIVAVPLVVGEWKMPRMRVFEYEKRKNLEGSIEGEQVQMREIQVTEEMDLSEIKDPKQISLERELRKARGEKEDMDVVVEIREFRTLVLPA